MRVSEISIEIRHKIVTLRDEGFSHREIAEKLKLSKGGVQYTLRRHSDTGNFFNRSGRGRKKCTSSGEDKHIIVMSKMDRKLTAPDIREEVNSTRDCPVSVTTIKRRLREAGLKGCVAAKKPLLRPINKLKRLRWAKKYINWTADDWKNVLFTDESKFELFGAKRRVYVRRREGERMMGQCISPTVKHGGGSIMVWGCFGNGQVGKLFKIEGKMKKEEYHNILVKHAIPSGLKVIGPSFYFQQDNDPKHTSKLCQDYLIKKVKENKLRLLDHPPQSPDCNPIEFLWDEVDRKVRQKRPTNVKNLWFAIQDVWENISEDYLNKLIARMPRVCAAVIKAKGSYFEESKI